MTSVLHYPEIEVYTPLGDKDIINNIIDFGEIYLKALQILFYYKHLTLMLVSLDHSFNLKNGQ